MPESEFTSGVDGPAKPTSSQPRCQPSPSSNHDIVGTTETPDIKNDQMNTTDRSLSRSVEDPVPLTSSLGPISPLRLALETDSTAISSEASNKMTQVNPNCPSPTTIATNNSPSLLVTRKKHLTIDDQKENRTKLATNPLRPMSSKSRPIRCHACRKKLGFVVIKCRCGQAFCGTHRPITAHACPYDFKAEAQARLTESMVPCVSRKIARF